MLTDRITSSLVLKQQSACLSLAAKAGNWSMSECLTDSLIAGTILLWGHSTSIVWEWHTLGQAISQQPGECHNCVPWWGSLEKIPRSIRRIPWGKSFSSLMRLTGRTTVIRQDLLVVQKAFEFRLIACVGDLYKSEGRCQEDCQAEGGRS